MNFARRLLLILFAASFIWSVTGHTHSSETFTGGGDEPANGTSAEGIPVKSAVVVANCGACHKQDDKGLMSRISFERRTPEGWEQAIKRMVRLNDARLSPEDARQIVKYLSKFHGLAPEESQQAFYEAEHRPVDEKAPSEGIRMACMQCHSLGRIKSQRRTPEEWRLLVNLHVGMFPFINAQGFYRYSLPPGLPPPPDADSRDPVEGAIDYLAKTYPLITPEWQAWNANIPTPRLEGRWLITGYQVGRGPLYGEMTISPTQVEDEFSTRIDLKGMSDGSSWKRNGRGIVYAGHSWRGRSNGEGQNGPESAREALLVSRDWERMEGRWFWGGYDEFAMDVKLRRVGREPIIAMLDRPALKAGLASQRLTIHGASLPADVKASDIRLGSGITVSRVISAQSDSVTLEVAVAADTPNGLRDISLGQSVAAGAIAVFDRVDYIKVLPNRGLARIGGVKYPKQHQQFEAVAFNRGPDETQETSDDLVIGPVSADWSLEEFPGSFRDDDKDYVGSVDKHGLFTPAVEGPNPRRHRSGNNFGDVWVVASHKPDVASSARPLTARSYLLVTVPLYVRWDTPEVSR